jgi:hypothetical protein
MVRTNNYGSSIMNSNLGMSNIRELTADELDLVTGGATVSIGNIFKIEAGNGGLTIGINGVGYVTLGSDGTACGSLRGVGTGCVPH